MTIWIVAIASYFINYATEVRTGTSSATGAIYLAVAQACFAVGRFSGSLAMKFVKARYDTLIQISTNLLFCIIFETFNDSYLHFQ